MIPAAAAVFAASIVGAAAGAIVAWILIVGALVVVPAVAFIISALGRRAFFAAALMTATPLLAAGGIQLAYALDVSVIDLARSGSEDETNGELLWIGAIFYCVPLGLLGLAVGALASWWGDSRYPTGSS